MAVTGAGISVESGIPDFRSPDGLWKVFDPMEFATLTCFLENPAKSWRLFRALGKVLHDKRPNGAHRALAELERTGRLAGVVTQNVDGLHRAAGSSRVVEIHGDGSHVRCLRCGRVEPFRPEWLEDGPVPLCADCRGPMKPDVVLFEEAVRGMDEAFELVDRCDLLLLLGTSAEVWPASSLPERAMLQGIRVAEFNVQATRLTPEVLRRGGIVVCGRVSETLPPVVAEALRGSATA